MALHFPLLISAPKEIPITAEQHDQLSVYGLGTFMISYPICFADKGDHLIMYCPEDKGNYYHSMPRFREVIPGMIRGSVEMAEFKIPKTTKLFKTIDTYFKHLFLKH